MLEIIGRFIDQVNKSEFTDEIGHKLTMNHGYLTLVDAYRDANAKAFLDKPPSGRIRGFEEVEERHMKTHAHQTAIAIPKRGSQQSAGYDFVTPVALRIEPGKKVFFWTDVCAYMQPGEVLILDVRSSAGTKKDVMLANTIGVVDTDYYHNPDNGGNIGISLRNLSDELVTFEAGERVAQGIFFPFLAADNGNTDTERQGGFGSTGV